MIKEYCDICKKEITINDDNIERYKVKKQWHSFHESGWENLTVHHDCWYQLCEEIKRKNETYDIASKFLEEHGEDYQIKKVDMLNKKNFFKKGKPICLAEEFENSLNRLKGKEND